MIQEQPVFLALGVLPVSTLTPEMAAQPPEKEQNKNTRLRDRIGRLIVVADETNHCGVVCKHDDRVKSMYRSAVVGEESRGMDSAHSLEAHWC